MDNWATTAVLLTIGAVGVIILAVVIIERIARWVHYTDIYETGEDEETQW